MPNKQQKILESALLIVPFEGWGRAVLAKAAENIGLNAGYAQIAFPNGAIEAVELFLDNINKEVQERVKHHKLEEMKIRDKIFYILKIRFQIMQEYKAVMRKTSCYLALPQNICSATKMLWKMADSVWYLAGDKSTDFNYYTKRTTLMAVYSATLLYWLADDSDDNENTYTFLKRRIENIISFEKLKKRVVGSR